MMREKDETMIDENDKEIKEAFKNYDKAELGRYKTLIDKELFNK